jgi:hypothetical protein
MRNEENENEKCRNITNFIVPLENIGGIIYNAGNENRKSAKRTKNERKDINVGKIPLFGLSSIRPASLSFACCSNLNNQILFTCFTNNNEILILE